MRYLGKINNEKDLVTKEYTDTQVATKQDKLPEVVNDKYLHTNASTGALEWSDTPDTGVTSITAGNGLTGGTITSEGTIAVDSDVVALKTDLPTGQLDVTLNGTATTTTEELTNVVVGTKTYTLTEHISAEDYVIG